MSANIIIGVDLGGTKILTGAINLQGEVVGTPVKIPTESTLSGELIFEKITRSVQQVMKENGITSENLRGIGIGSTGPVDADKGIILECPQLPTMHYFPLRSELEKHFSVPVYVNNDANCLILAEAMFGAGKNCSSIVGFTLGTGLGCALVFNGKLWEGATGTAAEIWQSPYRQGHIEDFISGHGVSDIHYSITNKSMSALQIFQLAEQGDISALQTWRVFGKHLSVPLAWSINLIDPEKVILGGSIVHAYKYFKDTMEEYLRKNICPAPARRTAVVPSLLGDDAGFIGAASLLL